MTSEQLSAAIAGVLTDLAADGKVILPDGVPAQVVIERSKVREHGDYSTNVALQLAKTAGMSPRGLAALLAERLRETAGIASVDVAGPRAGQYRGGNRVRSQPARLTAGAERSKTRRNA